MKTLNKHIRWRKEGKEILICDCKRMIDLKMPLRFEKIMNKFEKGFDENKMDSKQKKLYLDLDKLNLISNLKIRPINTKEFNFAMKILDEELEKRVRDNKFLLEKFKEYPQFFLGLFLDNELIGVICGFPREDYLLISELAIKFPFHNKGFGKLLVKRFEEIAKKEKYKRINVGALDKAINFYNSLNFDSFLLIQYKKGDYSKDDFKELRIIKKTGKGGYEILEVDSKINKNYLEKLRKKYPKANFQYIFTTDKLCL